MLTRSEREQIYRDGVSVDHDYWFVSLLFGEPFFHDGGVISYFDGRSVVICGYPVNGELMARERLLQDLSDWWAAERGAERILFVGPNPVNFGILSDRGFCRILAEQRQMEGAEMVLDSTRATWRSGTKRVYDRARKHGFVARVCSGGISTADYMKLIERFFESRDLSGYLASLAFAVGAILRSSRVWIVEAWNEGKLCGIVVIHKPFAETAVGLFLAHDPEVPGVSDFLYSEMLDLSFRLRATTVNVGPSPTREQFEFKRKWGGVSRIPPYYIVEWAKDSLSQRKYPSWGPRLVRL